MYNADQKKSFIAQHTSSESVERACVGFFNALEKYEKQWGADVCAVDANIVKPAIESLIGMRDKSKGLRATIFYEYIRWCIENNIKANRELLEISIDNSAKMKLQTVRGPSHLHAFLNSICDPEDDATSDNIVRCFCWLAYAGMKEEDIFGVRSSDVDFSNMVVCFNGSEYPIYREAIKSIRNCAELKQFCYVHPNYSDGIVVKIDRIPGDILMRGIRSTPTVNSMRSILSRKPGRTAGKEERQERLSYGRIWLSGVFYRVYEDEIAGVSDVGMLFKQIARTMVLESDPNANEKKQKRTAWDLQRDYANWKQTFQNNN